MARRVLLIFLLALLIGASARAEGAMTPGDGTAVQNLGEALAFWQDSEVELRYTRKDGVCVAEALPAPIVVPVYVTNTSDGTVGPFTVFANAKEVTDAGGCFTLTCALLDAEALTLKPGESARVATFTFSGGGGESVKARTGAVRIELWAELAGEINYVLPYPEYCTTM